MERATKRNKQFGIVLIFIRLFSIPTSSALEVHRVLGPVPAVLGWRTIHIETIQICLSAECERVVCLFIFFFFKWLLIWHIFKTFIALQQGQSHLAVCLAKHAEGVSEPWLHFVWAGGAAWQRKLIWSWPFWKCEVCRVKKIMGVNHFSSEPPAVFAFLSLFLPALITPPTADSSAASYWCFAGCKQDFKDERNIYSGLTCT